MKHTILGIIAAVFVMAAMTYEPTEAQSPGETQPSTDLPHEKPATATGFFCNEGGNVIGVVAVIFTYPSGKLIRVDMHEMHGFKTPNEIMHYADSAASRKIYIVGCTHSGTDT